MVATGNNHLLDNQLLGTLLSRVALQDRTAFRQLYDHSSAHLLAVALRISGNRSVAEETLQDAFVQIWQNARTFSAARAQPSTWMTAIVRYRALDQLRKVRDELPLEDAPESALAAVQASGDAEPALERCLETLAPDPRSCITLAFVEGYSHEELSRRYRKPLGTVKSWIRRGLQQLKECLER
jgi:RNA polymerase sigma-70 factor (ECF subfamily)